MTSRKAATRPKQPSPEPQATDQQITSPVPSNSSQSKDVGSDGDKSDNLYTVGFPFTVSPAPTSSSSPLPKLVKALNNSYCDIPVRHPLITIEIKQMLTPFEKPIPDVRSNPVALGSRLIDLEALCVNPFSGIRPCAADIISTVSFIIQEPVHEIALNQTYLSFKRKLMSKIYGENFLTHAILLFHSMQIFPHETINQFKIRHRSIYWMTHPDAHYSYYKRECLDFLAGAKLDPFQLRPFEQLAKYDPESNTDIWIPLQDLFQFLTDAFWNDLTCASIHERSFEPTDVLHCYNTSFVRDRVPPPGEHNKSGSNSTNKNRKRRYAKVKKKQKSEIHQPQ